MSSIVSSIYTVFKSVCQWNQHASKKSLNSFTSQNKDLIPSRWWKITREESWNWIFLSCGLKIMGFHENCRLQIRIVYFKSQSNQWALWIRINGQLTVCSGNLLVFIQNTLFLSSVSSPVNSPFGESSSFILYVN